jgi:hypothetical protein
MAVVEGVAYWASVTTPNTKFEPVYTVNLIVSDDVAESFRSRGFTIKDMEEGPALIIRRKTYKKTGEPNQPPKLVDRNKNPIDTNVGNGSRVKVHYNEWESTWNGTVYKGLDFKGMQVLELVEYGVADGDEFDVLDDEEEL